jgi:hypothetical protein
MLCISFQFIQLTNIIIDMSILSLEKRNGHHPLILEEDFWLMRWDLGKRSP